jgi:hypothetical protein
MKVSRALPADFLGDLKHGVLAPLLERVLADRDLILELRGDYVDIYFKGQCLLQIEQVGSGYKCTTHEKFRASLDDFCRKISSADDSEAILKCFPVLKDNISRHRTDFSEIEVEQLIIRANNYARELNTEYFILDRQYVESGSGIKERPDLIGVLWERAGRKRGQDLPLVLFEVKYGLNKDIGQLCQQVERYHKLLHANLDSLAEDYENLFRQKLELGLFAAQGDRLEAINTLRISRAVESVQCAVLLVDYNPHSRLLDTDSLLKTSFGSNLYLFNLGFGLWNANSLALNPSKPGEAKVEI